MQGREKRQTRIRLCLMLLAGLVLALMLLNLLTGSTGLGVKEIILSLGRRDAADAAARIVWQIRLPRLLAAA